MTTSLPDRNETPSPELKKARNREGLAGFMRGFVHAGRGIASMVSSEFNARFHLAATVGVIGAGFGFGISRMEWILVCLAIGLVWSAEAFNTAIEWLCDRVEPRRSEEIRRIKDVAAGGVLCAAIAAVAIGLLIFVPYLFRWWQ